MFYDQTRKDLTSDVESTRKFIDRANSTYLSDALADAVKVGFTSENIRTAFPGLQNLFGLNPSSIASGISSTVGSSGSLAGGTLSGATGGALENFRFDKGFYGGGYDATSLGNFGTGYSKRSLYNPLFGGISKGGGL